ncbi:MAG: BlaI/MecI/CopY family transcriptional regulator [Lachnospiraceae bacterium]|jgi:predicted transcriptional regulator|nr:BlaI/MecI/CopY family transcriptional regulator [Lachnospiraceae bacterium]
MNRISLSKKELDVMFVFWNTNEALTASDVFTKNPNLNFNTIQAVLKKLLKYEYIRVAGIVYHGTVLTRTYTAVLSNEEYLISQLQDNKFAARNLFSALVHKVDSPEVLSELECIIKEQKEVLGKEVK